MDAVIYIVQKTKGGRVVLITPSAKKVKQMLTPGLRAEMWVEGQKVATFYTRTREQIGVEKMPVDRKALMTLEGIKHRLTAQQYGTLKGQVLAGRSSAAMRGLEKIIQRGARA